MPFDMRLRYRHAISASLRSPCRLRRARATAPAMRRGAYAYAGALLPKGNTRAVRAYFFKIRLAFGSMRFAAIAMRLARVCGRPAALGGHGRRLRLCAAAHTPTLARYCLRAIRAPCAPIFSKYGALLARALNALRSDLTFDFMGDRKIPQNATIGARRNGNVTAKVGDIPNFHERHLQA